MYISKKTEQILLFIIAIFVFVCNKNVFAHEGDQSGLRALPPLVFVIFAEISPEEYGDVQDRISKSGGMISINYSYLAAVGRLPFPEKQVIAGDSRVEGLYYDAIDLRNLGKIDRVRLEAIKDWNALLRSVEYDHVGINETMQSRKTLMPEEYLVNDTFTVEQAREEMARAVDLQKNGMSATPTEAAEILRVTGHFKSFLVSDPATTLNSADWIEPDSALGEKMIRYREQANGLPRPVVDGFSFVIDALSDNTASVYMVNSKGVPTALLHLEKRESEWKIVSIDE